MLKLFIRNQSTVHSIVPKVKYLQSSTDLLSLVASGSRSGSSTILSSDWFGTDSELISICLSVAHLIEVPSLEKRGLKRLRVLILVCDDRLIDSMVVLQTTGCGIGNWVNECG